MKDVTLIVVITDIEYQLVRAAMNSIEEPEYIGSAFIERGDFSGRAVVICKIRDMGTKTNGSVGVALPAVFDSVKPSRVIEIGICFSLKSELSIGDVCVSRTVCDYEYQKIKNGTVLNRARSQSAPDPLFSQLSNFALNYSEKFRVLPGVYACGDKVVDDVDFKAQIIRAVPDALAGDMESYTLALVCAERGLPWSVIKGASDDGVHKDDNAQKVAVENAVKFLYDYLDKSQIGDSTSELEIDATLDGIDYKDISREIFGKKEIFSNAHDSARTAFEAHFHPDLSGAWAIIYVYRAHSVPNALRIFLQRQKSVPVRIDVCLVSQEFVSEQRIKSYEGQLLRAGCRDIYISSIKQFVFDRVIQGRLPRISVGVDKQYVDQKVYRDGADPITTKQYMRMFMYSGEQSISSLKPINVILGSGGIGKTTLCGNLAQHFSQYGNKKEFLLLLTKHDILRGYSGGAVDSITDLYREYRRGDAAAADSINDANFELALSCGSLIMMVDGIDEIEAALNGNFNMEGFIESIGQLDSILKSCKVFLTSRNIGAERFVSLSNADIFHLKGFSTEDVEEYLQKQPQKVAAAVNRIISKIKTKQGFVNPYLLSVATQIFEDGDGGNDMAGITNRLNSSDPFEYMLARLLSREIEKQSLEITVDEYYELLEHLVIECGNSMTIDDLRDYSSLMFRGKSKTGNVTGFLKCLLFGIDVNRVFVSHQEYASLVCTKYGLSLLTGSNNVNAYSISCLAKVLGADHNDLLGIKEDIVQSLWAVGANSVEVNGRIRDCLQMLKGDICAKSIAHARAIYALHLMALKFNRAKDGKDSAIVLKGLHGGNIIEGLFILGDFPLIDFCGLTIENCEFNGYQRFLSCKADAETKFKRSRLSNCDGKSNSGLFTTEMFDEHCTLDEGMNLALNFSADRKEGRAAKVRADLKRVLKAMRAGLGFSSLSLNRIKQTVVLASGNKIDVFLEELCKAGVLSFDANNSLYQVTSGAQRDAVFLCEEGHVQGMIARVLQDLNR